MFEKCVKMVSQADFAIAKINVLHLKPRFYRQIYHSVKALASLRDPFTNYDLLILCLTAPVSEDSGFVLKILSLTGNV